MRVDSNYLSLTSISIFSNLVTDSIVQMLRHRTRHHGLSPTSFQCHDTNYSPVIGTSSDEQLKVNINKSNLRAAENNLLLAKQREEIEYTEANIRYMRVVKQVRVGLESEGHWKKGQKSAKLVSEQTGFPRTTLRDDAKKLLNGLDIFKHVGRPKSSSSSLDFIHDCQVAASDRDMQQNSIRKVAGGSRNVGKIGGYDPRDQANTQFKFINDMHKTFVMKHVENPTCEQLKPLSEYLIAKAENLIFSDVTRALKEDRQNKRRLQANSDGYNFLSLAALVHVMFCMTELEELSNLEMETLLDTLGRLFSLSLLHQCCYINFNYTFRVFQYRDGQRTNVHP